MSMVTIRHVSNPMEAAMLVDLLEQEGITAFTPGNEHNAMMGGLLGSALNVPIRVDESDAERAMEILSALDDYDKVDSIPLSERDPTALVGESPYRGGPKPADDTSDRKTSVAIAAALILPCVVGAFGAGHFYARQTQRGFVLLVSAWLCIVYGFREQWAWGGVVLVVLLDMVGAASTIKRDAS